MRGARASMSGARDHQYLLQWTSHLLKMKMYELFSRFKPVEIKKFD
jgi:hypothetical protein